MSIEFLYQSGDIALRFLSHHELQGRYPQWFNDTEVCRHNSHGAFPMSENACRAYVDSLQGNRGSVVFAVYHSKDQQHIGNISLQGIDWLNRSAEIAFIFGEKAYWGKGHAARAARLVLHHAFDVLNLHRVHCGTAASNIGMQKLAAKLGMDEEGCRREALFLNGEYVDIVEYGVLRSGFLAQRGQAED